MGDQSPVDQSTDFEFDDQVLAVGVKLFVGGTAVFLVGGSIFDFAKLPSGNTVSYSDLMDRGFIDYILLLLMAYGAGAYGRKEDKTDRKATWLYRTAVWIGLYQLAISAFLLGSWYLMPGRALKAYWSWEARVQGLNPDLVADQINFSVASDAMSFGWWSGISMVLGLLAMAVGLFVIWACHSESNEQEGAGNPDE